MPNSALATSPSALEALQQDLAETPDGVLETMAEKHGLTMQAVLDALPEGHAAMAQPEHFEAIWKSLTTWGPVMFIVHTLDGVFECKAPLPEGSEGRGYFNIHGDSALGGHLRKDRCVAIAFVDRLFFKRRSCSIQFINSDGGVMFKVFVARDSEREMLPNQLAAFEALRQEYA